MYRIGDKVVHPMHGAGIIEDIVEQQAGDNVFDYYVVKLTTNSMLVMVPVHTCEHIGVRPVIDCVEADRVINAIGTMESCEDTNWNKRYRDNMSHIKSGDLMQVAQVVKSLVLRDREKGLSTGERKMLSSAKQILISEIGLVKETSYEEIEGIINVAIS